MPRFASLLVRGYLGWSDHVSGRSRRYLSSPLKAGELRQTRVTVSRLCQVSAQRDLAFTAVGDGSDSEWPPVQGADSGGVEVVLASLRALCLGVDRALHRLAIESLADVLDGPLLSIGRRHIVCALGIWKVEVAV